MATGKALHCASAEEVLPLRLFLFLFFAVDTADAMRLQDSYQVKIKEIKTVELISVIQTDPFRKSICPEHHLEAKSKQVDAGKILGNYISQSTVPRA